MRNIETNKSFYIETFGCQMNKCDSELMVLSMSKVGFFRTDNKEIADVCIFNTCSVREHAESRAISHVRSLRNRVRKRGGIIVVAGCMAQRIGPQLVKDDYVDIVIGPYQSPKIGGIITTYLHQKESKIYLSQERTELSSRINSDLVRMKDSTPWHKWVTITHGCGNYCSYCIVPSVRGPLVSFASESIIEYIKSLVESGITEITLLGQNVNQYGQDNDEGPFDRLLEQTASVSGLDRINFLTSHPKDFNIETIKVIRDHENISRSIHLPLQSGSDKILKLMNRKYTMEHYLTLTQNIKETLDDFSISTDLIVGFPGETEHDFQKTLDAVKQVSFDQAFMYAYSPREGTGAYKLKELLSQEEKIQRLNTLIDLQRGILAEHLQGRLNRTETVIIEKISKRSEHEVMGKTQLNHPVVIPGVAADLGKKLRVVITDIKGTTLFGERIT